MCLCKECRGYFAVPIIQCAASIFVPVIISLAL